MAAIKGTDGVLKIGASGDTEVAIAQVKSYSLTESSDTAEMTSMGNDTKTFIATLKSWEGSADLVYDLQDNVSGSDLAAGTAIDLELYPDEDHNPAAKYSGAAIVTSFEVTADVGDIVSATVNFQGTDTLSRTPA